MPGLPWSKCSTSHLVCLNFMRFIWVYLSSLSWSFWKREPLESHTLPEERTGVKLSGMLLLYVVQEIKWEESICHYIQSEVQDMVSRQMFHICATCFTPQFSWKLCKEGGRWWLAFPPACDHWQEKLNKNTSGVVSLLNTEKFDHAIMCLHRK